MVTHKILYFTNTQVQIVEADNTAKYWPNLGSQQSAKTWAHTKPNVTFTMVSNSESRRARVWPMDGTLLAHVSLLPRQTILEVRKPEFGTALAHCCAENKF